MASPRYTYRPVTRQSRLIGAVGVLGIAIVVLAGALFTWTTYQAVRPAQELAVFDVAPPAAPPEPVRKVKPGPEREQTESQRPKVDQPVFQPLLVPAPSVPPVTEVTAKSIPDPGPPVSEASAPEAKPMPSAPQPSNATPTWQGLVLTALNKARRYPREASFRREQGIPYIRFVMDREGKVLSSRLERSSGVRSLDNEAVGLPKRAQPLPKPPEEVKGDTIELVVPVEFFMR